MLLTARSSFQIRGFQQLGFLHGAETLRENGEAIAQLGLVFGKSSYQLALHLLVGVPEWRGTPVTVVVPPQTVTGFL
ncbi:MAG: hypothetical protein ACREP4_12050 [Stenotrophomonas sp.]|uniref:hypothetical protein n=1 Tax=Stenotrophomonas sp. TaxID=69392 RepID=UPI003D6D7278